MQTESIINLLDMQSLHIPYLREALVFLIASVTVVPLFQKMKASPVLGYLAVGVLIGPSGLSLINDQTGIKSLADFGVLFLLFIIGLNLSMHRLIAMRHYIFGLGFLQVTLTSLIVGIVAYLWGNSLQVSILLGGCFALSSTAIVSQILMERKELLGTKGRVIISILLAQDIAVVPLLVLISVFSQESGASLGIALSIATLKAIVAVALIVLLGRLLLRPVFRLAETSTRSPELFTATTLLIILLTSALTYTAGLSMEMGAFLAGLLLAETEHHNRIEADIKPFQGLLLGLFFITVGMKIDVHAVMDSLFWLFASVIGIYFIKTVIIFVLCRLFRISNDVALPAGLMLGQGGEFLYVVVGTAMAVKLMPENIGQFMLLVTALSMVLTPFFSALSDKAGTFLTPKPQG